jgi:hypothetical protein
MASSVPLTVTQEKLPDNTVCLGKKDNGWDFLHTCVVVRRAQSASSADLTTTIRAARAASGQEVRVRVARFSLEAFTAPGIRQARRLPFFRPCTDNMSLQPPQANEETTMKRTLILLTALLLTLLAAAHAADPVTTQARWENSELIYEQPAMSPDAGQPIGNGRMGTMLWTSPDAIHLQINRVDVFAVNRDHQGQPGQRGSATDYCGGIAAVVVHVGGQPFAPGEKSFRQRLSLESAECAIESTSLHVRCFISADSDVLVMEVDDRRASPERLKVTVSMLRKPEVRAGENIATCTFSENQSRIVLTQRFRERDYHNASAVAVGVAGNGAVIDQPSSTSRTLVLPAAQKKQVILISSAAAWKPERDVAEAAVALVNVAGSRSVGELRASHRIWWREFP